VLLQLEMKVRSAIPARRAGVAGTDFKDAGEPRNIEQHAMRPGGACRAIVTASR
jgi:hypothetical protein